MERAEPAKVSRLGGGKAQPFRTSSGRAAKRTIPSCDWLVRAPSWRQGRLMCGKSHAFCKSPFLLLIATILRGFAA